MLNAFTIDLEEWFCVSNFEDAIPRAQWPQQESRVQHSTCTLLDLLDKHDVKATFFILGWVAERHPELIRDIADRGHETASHGYAHQLVYSIDAKAFREDIERSVEIISALTGRPCGGYRAPSFSIRRNMDWAWEVLQNANIEYDSSIFPIRHDRYGQPDAPRSPFVIKTPENYLLECPMSTLRLMGQNFPVAGGGYLRLYPYWFTRWAVARLNREGLPAIVYIHPWEIDPEQPKPPASRLKLWRHRVGMRGLVGKLDRLLGEFEFGPMRRVIDNLGDLQPWSGV